MKMGHPRPTQNRPDRLPLADPPLHRPRRADPVRPRRPGPRHRRPRRRPLLRHQRRHLHPPPHPGPGTVHIRGTHPRASPRRRPGPDPPRRDRARRRHRRRPAHRPARAGAAGHRPGRAARRRRRPTPAGTRPVRLRRPLRLVPTQQPGSELMDRTVLYVCAHGAGRSRLAAAWLNADPPTGWHATTAAREEPSDALNPRGTPYLAPRPPLVSRSSMASVSGSRSWLGRSPRIFRSSSVTLPVEPIHRSLTSLANVSPSMCRRRYTKCTCPPRGPRSGVVSIRRTASAGKYLPSGRC